MTPATYNLAQHTSGDTWNGLTVSIQVNASDPEYPLSSVKMQVRKRTFSPVALEFSTENSEIVITDSTSWEFYVKPQIVSLLPGTYFYDIQTTDQNGSIKTYISGNWVILKDITRP